MSSRPPILGDDDEESSTMAEHEQRAPIRDAEFCFGREEGFRCWDLRYVTSHDQAPANVFAAIL